MQELHDGAGIYITFCKRIVLRGNFVHDITDTGGFGASAYYLDEQAEGCLVERNVARNVAWPSHNHMARKNTIRNNIFLAEGDMKLTFPRSSGYTFERDILSATGTVFFSGVNAIAAMPSNVIFSAAGVVEVQDLRDYAERDRRPFEPREGTVLGDPLLVSPSERSYDFQPGAPALGIEPVLLDVPGLTGSQA